MIEQSVYKEYHYSGKLSQHCQDFIHEKRSIGYIYNSEAKLLSQFSRFTLDYEIQDNELSEEIVKDWISKKPYESDRTRFSRYSLVKQFAEYLKRTGVNAYIPTNDDIKSVHISFTPYIFTHEEISRFFDAANAMTLSPHSISPQRHIVMPVIFKLLYCCGLRVSEALCLQGNDVDLTKGILTIRNSKFGKSRYVPMSPEMTEVCRIYNENRIRWNDGPDWFFVSPKGGRYDKRIIYDVFRDLLWKAGIPHKGRGKGPRVHDFRHTMAVHSLQQWIVQGIDVTTQLPALSAYLGHKGLKSTEKYLRLTAEVYPEVSQIMQSMYGDILPGGDLDR